MNIVHNAWAHIEWIGCNFGIIGCKKDLWLL